MPSLLLLLFSPFYLNNLGFEKFFGVQAKTQRQRLEGGRNGEMICVHGARLVKTITITFANEWQAEIKIAKPEMPTLSSRYRANKG